MTPHTCGTFIGPKLTACCACCQVPVYTILETIADGPRAGEAARVGLMLDSGTQVEVMLSDGSIAHFDLCLDCAKNLTPESLFLLWDTNVRRRDVLERLAGRRDNQRRAIVRAVARIYPLGVTR